MTQLPTDDNTPFSLPRDTSEVMPIDYAELIGDVNTQEDYDKWLDDDLIKSAKHLMITGISSHEYYTTNHDLINSWTEYRYGHPVLIVGAEDGLDRGDMYITFEDDEPNIYIKQSAGGHSSIYFSETTLHFCSALRLLAGRRASSTSLWTWMLTGLMKRGGWHD